MGKPIRVPGRPITTWSPRTRAAPPKPIREVVASLAVWASDGVAIETDRTMAARRLWMLARHMGDDPGSGLGESIAAIRTWEHNGDLTRGEPGRPHPATQPEVR